MSRLEIIIRELLLVCGELTRTMIGAVFLGDGMSVLDPESNCEADPTWNS